MRQGWRGRPKKGSWMPQFIDYKTWQIIEHFYKASLVFRQMHDTYERKVLAHAKEKNTPRENLKLGPMGLAELLDFQNLEKLRDRYLLPLKTYCHEIFRGHDKTDQLDRYVSDIFHEISILKEEHYMVEHYATGWADAKAEVELTNIMDEAFEVIPRKIKQINYLFNKATERVESLLPAYQRNRVLIRSLFLNRHGFVSESYAEGLVAFYQRIFPVNGAIEGFYKTGLSFMNSSFFEKAIETFQEGLDHLQGETNLTPKQKEIQGAIPHYLRRAGRSLAKQREASLAFSQKDKT